MTRKRRVEDGEEEEFEGEEWEEGKSREGAHPERDETERVQWCCRCCCCCLGLAHWHSLPVLSGTLLPLHPATGHWTSDQPEPKGRVPAHGPISDAAPPLPPSPGKSWRATGGGDERVNDGGRERGAADNFFQSPSHSLEANLASRAFSGAMNHGLDGVGCWPCRYSIDAISWARS